VHIVDDQAERTLGGQVSRTTNRAHGRIGNDGSTFRRGRAVRSGWHREALSKPGRHAGGGLQQIVTLQLRCFGQRRLDELTQHSRRRNRASSSVPARPAARRIPPSAAHRAPRPWSSAVPLPIPAGTFEHQGTWPRPLRASASAASIRASSSFRLEQRFGSSGRFHLFRAYRGHAAESHSFLPDAISVVAWPVPRLRSVLSADPRPGGGGDRKRQGGRHGAKRASSLFSNRRGNQISEPTAPHREEDVRQMTKPHSTDHKPWDPHARSPRLGPKRSSRIRFLARRDAGYDAARARAQRPHRPQTRSDRFVARPCCDGRCGASPSRRRAGLEGLDPRRRSTTVAGRAVTDGGVMIDLAQMKAIAIDPEAGHPATAEGGVLWGELNGRRRPSTGWR